MKLAASLSALVVSIAVASGAARADVPAFVDGPVFAKLCKSVGQSLECPSCKCEAVTSTPSIGVTKEASSILHGILVQVTGKTADGTRAISEVRVFLGDETALVDGGVVVNHSRSDGEHKEGEWSVVKSQQTYDMCPGACDWDAVGQVHLFEIRDAWREGLSSLDDVLEHDMRTLYVCFEHDKKPGCHSLELGMETREVTGRLSAKKPKLGKKSARSRTWKVGGRSGFELVLSKYSGNSAKEYHERSGREIKAMSLHFAELIGREDTFTITP